MTNEISQIIIGPWSRTKRIHESWLKLFMFALLSDMYKFYKYKKDSDCTAHVNLNKLNIDDCTYLKCLICIKLYYSHIRKDTPSGNRSNTPPAIIQKRNHNFLYSIYQSWVDVDVHKTNLKMKLLKVLMWFQWHTKIVVKARVCLN